MKTSHIVLATYIIKLHVRLHGEYYCGLRFKPQFTHLTNNSILQKVKFCQL